MQKNITLGDAFRKVRTRPEVQETIGNRPDKTQSPPSDVVDRLRNVFHSLANRQQIDQITPIAPPAPKMPRVGLTIGDAIRAARKTG